MFFSVRDRGSILHTHSWAKSLGRVGPTRSDGFKLAAILNI